MEALSSAALRAGWRRPPWAGQGEQGPESPTPGLPHPLLSLVFSRSGPILGFGLHPVGMMRRPWSTPAGWGAPGSGTPSEVRAGGRLGGGCMS